MNKLPKKYKNILKQLDIAFQPILNIHTGKIYAVEALLRNHLDAGFKSIFDIFDTVSKDNALFAFDIALREKTFQKFTTIENYESIKLFYNLDNRLFEMPDFESGNTNILLKRYNIAKENICFEISERYEVLNNHLMEKVLQHYKNENFYIAIDDFGVGHSGYKLLFDSTPDIIKIDRYFLQNIEKDRKKRLMVASITHLAIQLGIEVLAEGVETQAEYLTCKEIGCNLVQGYFVQHPTKETQEIKHKYTHITEMLKSSKRDEKSSQTLKYIEQIVPLVTNTSMDNVVEYFKEYKNTPYVPVVNEKNEPKGSLPEDNIKEYLYSPYGIALLLNNTKKQSKLKNLMISAPSIDISSSISMIIELFSNNSNSHGIIITKNSLYYGFLSSKNIIKAMNEENLLLARDQNPLTKMPGNRVIEEYMQETLNSNKQTILCYFDLDNFKAFNDAYGFRNGDRIIQLFANILTKHLPKFFFKGHIGGDDFFVVQRIQESGINNALLSIIKIIEIFENNARDFYSQNDKGRGYIIAQDREGNKKQFPFLTVSAAILLVNMHGNSKYLQNAHEVLAIEKKVAKHAPNHLSISSLL